MHDHHMMTANNFNQPNNTIHGLGYEYGFGYSPLADCPGYDADAIGTDFNCISPHKARVR
jgi:hypothetical protein